MELLTGCRDNAVLALAETAALAAWKARELQRGSLSVRELVRRADAIEKAMKTGGPSSRFKVPERSSSSASSYSSSEQHQIGISGHLFLSQSPVPSPTAPSPSSIEGSVPASSPSTTSSVGWAIHSMGAVFYDTALLYLHAVVSDNSPSTYRTLFHITKEDLITFT